MLFCSIMESIFRANLLKDKVAFVTGGGSGIGLRMAERFAEHGAAVVLGQDALGQRPDCRAT